MKKISDITKRNIQDYLRINNINWAGRLDEIEFLSRLYNLNEMPTKDPRFSNFAGDIRQHRVNNYDWDDYWIFSDERLNLRNCDDSDYLKLLCEMLHPVVRSDCEETTKLIQVFNNYLRPDGYRIAENNRISEKPVFAATAYSGLKTVYDKEKLINILSSEYVSQQIATMEKAIENSPHIAIGLSKDLIETILKNVLLENKIEIGNNMNLPQLMTEVAKLLNLVPKNISDEKKGAENIKAILSNLVSMVYRIGELRNVYGSGHGKDGNFKGLQPRHAKLAVGASSTLAVFLLETWEFTKSKYSQDGG
jgi:hypothetical protein